MDFNKLIERVKNILLKPNEEWPVIASEPATVASIYKDYAAILAAIGPVAGFIGMTVFGISVLGITVRTPIGLGLATMIFQYAAALGVLYVMALIVDALAPTFGGEKNLVQALKTVAYASTASWVVGIVGLLPALSLLAILGLFYSIYLTYVGLPHTMKVPADRAAGYTAAIAVIWLVVALVVGMVIGVIAGAGQAAAGVTIGSTQSSVTVDKDSALGALAAWGESVEKAGKAAEEAQKSGDAQAQAESVGAVMGALMGAGGKVEALDTSTLKGFVPEELAGLARESYSAERNGAVGFEVAMAKARYADEDGRYIELEIADMGAAKAIMGLAGWAAIEKEEESSDGYEKVYTTGGRLTHEQWSESSEWGEFGMIVGDRFAVKLQGSKIDMDTLREAAESLDLDELEALKDHGVSKG